MKRPAIRGQKSSWKKYLLLTVMLVWGFCFAEKSVLAEETANRNQDLTVQLTETASISPTEVIIHAILPQYTNCDYEIYRASKNPLKGGRLKLLDSISPSKQSWTPHGTLEYTTGPKKRIECYRSGEMTGGVIFVDVQAKLGKTYWYQVALKDRATKIVWRSNVIAGSPELPAPVIKKCYTVSNSSVKLMWTRVSKAQGYEIYRRSGSGSWKRVKTLRNKLATGYKDKKLKTGKTYQYKMRAYHRVKKKKVYSKFSAVYTIKTKTPSVKGVYKKGSVYGKKLSASKLTQVRRVVQSFQDNYIKPGMTDYEKLWTAFRFLRDNCSYTESGKKNGADTAWGALVYGKAQSSGYARAMKALCDASGIRCYCVHANSMAVDSSHQWVQVKIDGKWYVVDAQGGYFLVGANTWKHYAGMSWNTKGLPELNEADHAGGGIVSGEK